ncbi:hypothetical protein GCM10020216_064510 [Nonomuraea helvata]
MEPLTLYASAPSRSAAATRSLSRMGRYAQASTRVAPVAAARDAAAETARKEEAEPSVPTMTVR